MKKDHILLTSRLKNLTAYLLKIAALSVIYHLAVRLGLNLAYVQANTSPVWLPTGIALAALLFFGLNLWPGISIGVFLGSIITGAPLDLAFGMTIGNTLEAVVGAYVLEHIFEFHNAIDRIRDVMGLAGVSIISTTISASIGTSTLMFVGFEEWANFGGIWFTWWIGDLLGALVVAPVLLVWMTSIPDLPRKQLYFEGGIFFTLSDIIFV